MSPSTTSTDHGPSADGNASSKRLGAPALVFFVISAAAPLGFSLGATPLALGRGGSGTAIAFVLSALVLGIFAVGYLAMAGHISRLGGLYEFVAEGLGKIPGVGASFVALLTYGLASAGAIGAFAVFADTTLVTLAGVSVPWPILAFGAVAVMGILGVLRVEVNARVLGVLMSLEIILLLVVSFGIIFHGGASGLSAATLNPVTVFHGNTGVMFAVTIVAFAGFESTVIFSAEVKDRRRTIGRATIASLVIMALLYAFVTWSVTQAFGDSKIVAAAAKDPIDLFFTAANTFVGPWAVAAMEILVTTSWFASVLAFHNATSRYLASMGADRVLPAWFARVHPRLGSPWRASLAHTVFSAIVVLVVMVVGGDPYLGLYVMASTPATLGIPVLELLASVAIIVFFIRNRYNHSIWVAFVAPGAATILLAVMVFLIAVSLPLFTGISGAFNAIFPGLLILALAGGIARGWWMRNHPVPPLAEAADGRSGDPYIVQPAGS